MEHACRYSFEPSRLFDSNSFFRFYRRSRAASQSPRGGGEGALIFSLYVGPGPPSTVHPQKYQEFQAPKNIFSNLKNTPILYLDLKKKP